MKIKLSDYIAKKVVDLGIKNSFSVTGGGAMHLNDSLGHQQLRLMPGYTIKLLLYVLLRVREALMQ